MSRRWLLRLCSVTYLYVARLVLFVYKALPGTYIFTYLTYPYYLHPYLISKPLYIYILTYPYTYLPTLYFAYPYTKPLYYLPLYPIYVHLYFVIGLPLLCTRYTYPYTYIYTYIYIYLFTYLAATLIFCRLLTPIYTNWAPLLCSSGMPYIFTYICTYILYIITSLFVNK